MMIAGEALESNITMIGPLVLQAIAHCISPNRIYRRRASAISHHRGSFCRSHRRFSNLLSRKWGKIKPTKRCKDLGLARAPPRRMRSKIAWFLCRDLLIQTSCSRTLELWDQMQKGYKRTCLVWDYVRMQELC
ncbi:uncharacterized protein LOC125198655 isoform X1 [Salvia hispanica]|uniref:uncharacterized protein LOC125198655 isoform X1 n=1 Tax=Salvia hispanica TaxID=49212 RepID=UPI002009D918|nr:uncharacterized protein LOC125198655 isoform X1 [Salvia hispanica]XP_047952930.1 uncharacterized protein LOC125198655 isoform X1 [Salvia hispanica]